MCLELVSEEELVHALEFCGITPAKNPTDLSRDSVARLVSIMKTPILRDTPELVFSSVQDLLGIAGLSHKERVLTLHVAIRTQSALFSLPTSPRLRFTHLRRIPRSTHTLSLKT